MKHIFLVYYILSPPRGIFFCLLIIQVKIPSYNVGDETIIKITSLKEHKTTIFIIIIITIIIKNERVLYVTQTSQFFLCNSSNFPLYSLCFHHSRVLL